jgi:hypothetical protein
MLNPSLGLGEKYVYVQSVYVQLTCDVLNYVYLLKKYFNIRKSSCPAFSYYIKK